LHNSFRDEIFRFWARQGKNFEGIYGVYFKKFLQNRSQNMEIVTLRVICRRHDSRKEIVQKV